MDKLNNFVVQSCIEAPDLPHFIISDGKVLVPDDNEKKKLRDKAFISNNLFPCEQYDLFLGADFNSAFTMNIDIECLPMINEMPWYKELIREGFDISFGSPAPEYINGTWEAPNKIGLYISNFVNVLNNLPGESIGVKRLS